MVLRSRCIGTGKSVSRNAEITFTVVSFLGAELVYMTLITVRIKALYTSLQLFCFNGRRLVNLEQQRNEPLKTVETLTVIVNGLR